MTWLEQTERTSGSDVMRRCRRKNVYAYIFCSVIFRVLQTKRCWEKTNKRGVHLKRSVKRRKKILMTKKFNEKTRECFVLDGCSFFLSEFVKLFASLLLFVSISDLFCLFLYVLRVLFRLRHRVIKIEYVSGVITAVPYSRHLVWNAVLCVAPLYYYIWNSKLYDSSKSLNTISKSNSVPSHYGKQKNYIFGDLWNLQS